MTPASWGLWIDRFRARGHEVIAPGWPGIDNRSVAEVRADPSPLRGIGLSQIADHYEAIIRALPRKPIIMGHSFGGVLTQMLADRGVGAAYVGVEPGQTAGVPTVPLSTIRSGLPILSNPFALNGAKPISKRQFHYTFGNDLSRAESDAAWEQYAVNSYNRVLFEGVAAVFNGRSGVSRVDYARADRAPLLVIVGGADHVVPPAIGKALVARYRRTGSPAIVDYKEFPGRTHRIVTQDGWEEVADYALEWALAHVTPAPDGSASRADAS
jgi:pimeloyl-ACP methyl ester carboxylesterase